MAALLETARKIGQQNQDGATRKNTIIFAAFDLEEYRMYFVFLLLDVVL